MALPTSLSVAVDSRPAVVREGEVTPELKSEATPDKRLERRSVVPAPAASVPDGAAVMVGEPAPDVKIGIGRIAMPEELALDEIVAFGAEGAAFESAVPAVPVGAMPSEEVVGLKVLSSELNDVGVALDGASVDMVEVTELPSSHDERPTRIPPVELASGDTPPVAFPSDALAEGWRMPRGRIPVEAGLLLDKELLMVGVGSEVVADKLALATVAPDEATAIPVELSLELTPEAEETGVG